MTPNVSSRCASYEGGFDGTTKTSSPPDRGACATSSAEQTRQNLWKLQQLYRGLTGCQASRQAAQCPGFTSRSSGTTCRHRSIAIGQRGWNTQPDGGLSGLGTSPRSTTRSRRASSSGSGIGTADSSARVYGCSGSS